MNFENIILRTAELAKNTGRWIREQRNLIRPEDVELKDEHNFVTYVDRKSEEILAERLMEFIPGCGFIAEESQYGNPQSDLKWIVDPLDGTTNFIHGVPVFAVSIGLMEGENMVGGVVYEVNREECFYSWKGGKAYLDGKEIRVSEAATLADSLLVTGFPYNRDLILDRYMELFKAFIRKTRDLRRLGSASTDLAYVAAGRFEGFYEYDLCPWDVAAGAFLVRQAGGAVTDFSGCDDFIFGGSLVSSNSRVHLEMLEVVRSNFNID